MCLYQGGVRVLPRCPIVGRSVLSQAKPPTGEPYAGEPHVRFGGRGDRVLNRSFLPLSGEIGFLLILKCAHAQLCATKIVRQVARRNAPAVGDCPDFRAAFAERKWDCPNQAFTVFRDLPYKATSLYAKLSPRSNE